MNAIYQFVMIYLKIFATYLLTYLTIPVSLWVGSAILVLAVLSLPITWFAGAFTRRICWWAFRWARWAEKNIRWVIPPLTILLVWPLPGLLIVPMVGAPIAYFAHQHFLMGFVLGVGVYDVILFAMIQYGEKVEVQRWHKNMPPVLAVAG